MSKTEIIIDEYLNNKNIKVKQIYEKYAFSKGLISKVLNEQKRKDIVKKFNIEYTL